MPDARRSAAVAHSAGALAWMDCVHYAPHRRIDVKPRSAPTCCCARPTSSSARTRAWASARKELLESWPADRVRPASQFPAGHRFETGTMSHEALAGVKAAVDYVAALGEGADRRAKLDAAFRDIVAHEDGPHGHDARRPRRDPRHDALRDHRPRPRRHADADVHVHARGITPRQVCERSRSAASSAGTATTTPSAIMNRARARGPRRRRRASASCTTPSDEEVDRTLEALTEIARA